MGITHEQFDEKVEGLAAAYKALRDLDLTISGVTEGAVSADALYGFLSRDGKLNSDFERGRHAALGSLAFDVGAWGRRAHDSDVVFDEASEDERLNQVGVMAMMTAPKDEDAFNHTALSLFELVEAVVQKQPIRLSYPKDSFRDDVVVPNDHEGGIRATFENGHISSQTISVWSHRPEDIHAEDPNRKGFFPQVHFPLFSLDLPSYVNGKAEVELIDVEIAV